MVGAVADRYHTKPAPHGTRNRYQYRPRPCRCNKCRRANAAFMRERRAARAAAKREQQLELPLQIAS